MHFWRGKLGHSWCSILPEQKFIWKAGTEQQEKVTVRAQTHGRIKSNKTALIWSPSSWIDPSRGGRYFVPGRPLPIYEYQPTTILCPEAVRPRVNYPHVGEPLRRNTNLHLPWPLVDRSSRQQHTIPQKCGTETVTSTLLPGNHFRTGDHQFESRDRRY